MLGCRERRHGNGWKCERKLGEALRREKTRKSIFENSDTRFGEGKIVENLCVCDQSFFRFIKFSTAAVATRCGELWHFHSIDTAPMTWLMRAPTSRQISANQANLNPINSEISHAQVHHVVFLLRRGSPPWKTFVFPPSQTGHACFPQQQHQQTARPTCTRVPIYDGKHESFDFLLPSLTFKVALTRRKKNRCRGFKRRFMAHPRAARWDSHPESQHT